MPELPEVETTRRGISRYVKGSRIIRVEIRQAELRWKIPADLDSRLVGGRVREVDRRGKYLLLRLASTSLMIHLGMSGSLRIVDTDSHPRKHDHVDFQFENQKILRYSDPRRFGSILLLEDDNHPLLKDLGPEPLGENFSPEYLYKKSRGRTRSIKSFLMDSHIVVGLGNIYVSEILFMAGVKPSRRAGQLTPGRYQRIVECTRQILGRAIDKGGTTLKDFVREDGNPGYFKQELLVYGRGDKSCVNCQTKLKEIRQSQRSTVYCPKCQS